jgi:rubredoxin
MEHARPGTERRECGICWTVYDPADGDPVAQVPPGTPFEALPETWTCPQCGVGKEFFQKVS